MTRPSFPVLLGVGAAVLSASGAFIVEAAGRRAVEREYAVRAATSAAGYLSVVTGAASSGPGDAAARLLVRARALAALPGWNLPVEVYLGGAPLVYDTGASLDPRILAVVGRGPARWLDGAAVAPLAGADQGEPIGAVRVRGRSAGGWSVGVAAFFATAVLGVIAAFSAGRKRRKIWLSAYVLVVAVAALRGATDSRALASQATDRWLAETRLLLEDAGSRMARMSETDAAGALAHIGAGGLVVPGDSTAVEPRRVQIGGREWAVVAARLGPGRWLSLETDAGSGGVPAWTLIAVAVALLGPLGVCLAWWAARTSVHPRELNETLAAWAFVAPATVHLALFTLAPLGVLAYAVTHHVAAGSPVGPFVGLDNLRTVIGDPLVWRSLGETLLFALHVPVATATALGLALLVHRRPAMVTRALLAVPAAGSLVAALLVWQFLDRTLHWLDHPATALFAVAVVAAWVQVGYQVPVFLAGLDRIPAVYHDAARVDGAGAWQHFRRVTLPLLRPVLLFALVTGTIVAAQGFTVVFILTGAGPQGATDLIGYRIYREAWVEGRFDIASALAILLAVVLLAVTWMQFRILDRQVEHA